MLFKIPETYIKNKYILVDNHPKYNLSIYNYSMKTHYNQYWDKYTLTARGLVLDKTNKVIAKGFNKFFYLYDYYTQKEFEKLQKIEDKKIKQYYIFEKYDGVLIMVFRYKNDIIVCTRGSFENEYIKKAKEILHKKRLFDKIKDNKIYLFELIGKNIFKNVIEYQEEDLILLSVIYKNSFYVDGNGYLNHKEEQLFRDDIRKKYLTNGFKLAKVYNNTKIKEALSICEKKSYFEGFVVWFPFFDNLRVKIKSKWFFENKSRG